MLTRNAQIFFQIVLDVESYSCAQFSYALMDI